MKLRYMNLLLILTWASVSHSDVILKEAQLDGWQDLRQVGTTKYERVVDLEKGVVLRSESRGTASGYEYRQSINLKHTPVIQWQWTVEHLPYFFSIDESGIEKKVTTFDETLAAGNDFAVRITVGRYGLWGPKTLHYVWSSQQTVNSHWKETKDSYLIAVNGKETPLMRWQNMSRVVAEDWKLAFNEEIDSIDFVSFMTDTDNTQGKAVGYFGDIGFTSNHGVAGVDK